MRPTQPLEPPVSNADQQQPTADRPTEETNRPQHERHRFRIFHRRKAVTAQPEPSEGQQRQAEQDFWAQTLRKQRNLNIFTLLGVGAAFAAFLILRSTLHENQRATGFARQQAEAAQQEFELSERPWVSADPIQFSDLTFDKTGGHFTIRFLLKNTGHSPAGHTHIEAELIPFKFGERILEEPLERQKTLCDEIRNRKVNIQFAAFILFPGDQTTRDVAMSMTQEDIASAEFRPAKDRPFYRPRRCRMC